MKKAILISIACWIVLLGSNVLADQLSDKTILATLDELGNQEQEMIVRWVLIITKVDRGAKKLDRHLVMPYMYSTQNACEVAARFQTAEDAKYSLLTKDQKGRRVYNFPDSGVDSDCVPLLVED